MGFDQGAIAWTVNHDHHNLGVVGATDEDMANAYEPALQELADRVGVTRQTILSIEGGRYNPSVGLALLLAETFGVPVEALFELDREEDHG